MVGTRLLENIGREAAQAPDEAPIESEWNDVHRAMRRLPWTDIVEAAQVHRADQIAVPQNGCGTGNGFCDLPELKAVEQLAVGEVDVGQTESGHDKNLGESSDDDPALQRQTRRLHGQPVPGPGCKAMVPPRQRDACILAPSAARQPVDDCGGFLHQNHIRAMVRDECFHLLQAGSAGVQNIPADDLHLTTTVPVTGLSSALAPVAAKFVYAAAAFAVGIESLGLPIPGETALISAAIYAGATHRLNIFVLVGAASLGGILGGAIGFWIGRNFGLTLLVRHGALIGMTPRRIKLAQYLFLRHGGKVVFFGRFVVVLRTLAALLAGANAMAWPRFMAFNALGALVWASLYGFGAFHFGKAVQHLAWPLALAMGGIATAALVLAFLFVRRHEKLLEAAAERALPGTTDLGPGDGNS